jgi:hypothetical protein
MFDSDRQKVAGDVSGFPNSLAVRFYFASVLICVVTAFQGNTLADYLIVAILVLAL